MISMSHNIKMHVLYKYISLSSIHTRTHTHTHKYTHTVMPNTPTGAHHNTSVRVSASDLPCIPSGHKRGSSFGVASSLI